jgi:NAD(P)-dependent dehydrogenase (short-subunit alcohol dehydrogenase family)/dienelactone hydrolase
MATPTLSKHLLPGVLGEILIDVRAGGRTSDRPAVLVLHGFKGFKDWGMFPPFSQRLAQAGFIVVTPNLSGSGVDDNGEFSHLERFGHNTFTAELEDVRRVIDALKAGQLGVPAPSALALVGHSRGGGVAILQTARDPRIRALVTWAAISTVARWPEAQRTAWRAAGQTEIQNTRTGQILPLYPDVLDDIEQNASTLDIVTAASGIRVPWLLVHGRKDESVPFSEAERLKAAAIQRDTQLLPIPGGGHTFGAVHPWRSSTPDLDTVFDATWRGSQLTSGRPLANADLEGRVCVVTGASRGIGRATALGLAELGGSLVLVCRRREDGDAVAREIAESGGLAANVVTADLSSQASIRDAASVMQSRYSAIHVLINNAGTISKERQVTVDGLEMQFAVNHLAYFLLTNLLLPQLRAGAPARIINVSSGAHSHASLDFSDLQSAGRYEPNQVYGRTKLANILFTYELARRLDPNEVTVNTLTPGVVATGMLADYVGVPRSRAGRDSTFGATPEEGAETSIYLASSPEVARETGKYFERKKPAASSRQSHDEAAARRLWELSERLTGLST